jgi:hypothetical protein
MLLVNAWAGRSEIHGVGLVARERIPKGTRVWEFREGFDVKLSVEQLDALSPVARAQALHYGWWEEPFGWVVVAGADDRFVNHSESPNVTWDGKVCVAVRDIEPGEELTFDYRTVGGTDFLGWGNRLSSPGEVKGGGS